ncbi:MAG TPA: Xaa-Pro peptidase family protein [Vicinamibacterales bacterium]|nr:Xaa-Pro peptidase family protein [Vicinamibacterales bacterium]
MDRRTFIQTGTAAGLGAGLSACANSPETAQAQAPAPAMAAGPHPAIAALKPMTADVKPITPAERAARVAKAQQLMAQNKIAAILLEGGSSMFYFTGVRWGLSERPFVCVIPQKGELAWVSPAFEEERARELVSKTAEVRVWQEDESPYRQIAGILRDRGAASGRVGAEERLRFFIYDGVRKESPATDFVSADPVTAGCRMIKDAHELALMQKANDITIEAFRAAFATFKEGMTQDELRANIAAAHRALGVTGSAGVSFGEYTAFPHGSIEPQKLKEGDVIQVDGGCTVDGYQSDITRTTVFGKASARQTEIWNLEKKAQAAAFAVIKPGTPCEAVDAAARKVITDAGFGPDYKVPGLPHRTGHGIGLDGHEWTNFVRGNKTPLAPGMCFSNEPMIAIYGEFGIRLEDCLYVTETGATYFSQPSPSIDKPFA